MSSTKNQAVTHFNDGGKLYKVNLFSDALVQYQKAIDNDPTFHDAHFCLAKTLVRLKKYSEGIEHFKRYVHLIPKNNQGSYVLGLSNILIEEQQQSKALSLTDSLDVSFSEKQVFDYVPLLLSNNKIGKALNLILNLSDKNQIARGYKDLLESDNIPSSIIETLKKEDVVPRYFKAQKKIQLLQKAGIQHKEYKTKIDEASALLTQIRGNEHILYSNELNKLDTIIETSQDILAQQASIILKADNISFANKILSMLESTKYDPTKLQPFADKLRKSEKSKNQRKIKITVVSVLAVLIISTASYYAYNSYQESDAYDRAITSTSLSEYTRYLNKFGDNDEIHKLRETKLYEMALTSNDAQEINELSNFYPKSKHLKVISIKSDVPDYNSVMLTGVGNENNRVSLNGNRAYLVPAGCILNLSIQYHNKIPYNTYFTVAENMTITANLPDSETVLFEENFNNNKNNWSLVNDVKQLKYGSTQVNKKIAIENNKLNFFNNRGNKDLVYSLINVDGLNRSTDFEISVRINTTKHTTNGTYLMFGSTSRAFLYFGYSGNANNGKYVIGNNNWDDSSNNWKNWTSGWERAYVDSGYEATLSIEKKNNHFYYYINGTLVKDFDERRMYGSKIGFGVNGNTQSSISHLSVKKINKPGKTNFQNGNIYYCWVDELNVRADGSKNGKIITTIKLGEPVKYLGEVGKKELKATFRGQYNPDYYYKFELLDGTIGWVHGGALKGLNTKESISFSKYKNIERIDSPNETVSTDTSEFYMIAVYAEKERATIEKRVQEIKNKGYSANYLWIPDYKSLSGAEMYSAYIGPFSTQEQCKIKLNEVKNIYPKAYGLLASKNTTQRITIN